MSQRVPLQDSWTRAKNRYVEDLTEEEKHLYYRATPETLFYDASAAQKLHQDQSTLRSVSDNIQPFVSAIEQYGQALDVYSNAYPLILSPIWGSVRVLLFVTNISLNHSLLATLAN